MKDIRAGVKATQTTCPTGGRLHSGFKKQYDDVADRVEMVLDDEEVREKPLFITGHSLGGAVAAIAARRLSADRQIAACYTFGAPRVGTEEWVSRIKTPIYRIVNSADPVPTLPMSGTVMFFAAKALRAIGRAVPALGRVVVWLGDWVERNLSGRRRRADDVVGGAALSDRDVSVPSRLPFHERTEPREDDLDRIVRSQAAQGRRLAHHLLVDEDAPAPGAAHAADERRRVARRVEDELDEVLGSRLRGQPHGPGRGEHAECVALGPQHRGDGLEDRRRHAFEHRGPVLLGRRGQRPAFRRGAAGGLNRVQNALPNVAGCNPHVGQARDGVPTS